MVAKINKYNCKDVCLLIEIAMSINAEEVEKAETPYLKTSCRSVQFQTPRLVCSDEMPLQKVQCTSSTSVKPCRVTRLLEVNKFNLN